MFCAIQAATRAGIRENEDAVWAQRDFLFVIDGATGLSGENYMDPVSDARWFSGTTARLLRDMLPENGPLPEILRGAMERVRLQWQGPEEAMPTASIAIWRCRESTWSCCSWATVPPPPRFGTALCGCGRRRPWRSWIGRPWSRC